MTTKQIHHLAAATGLAAVAVGVGLVLALPAQAKPQNCHEVSNNTKLECEVEGHPGQSFTVNLPPELQGPVPPPVPDWKIPDLDIKGNR